MIARYNIAVQVASWFWLLLLESGPGLGQAFLPLVLVGRTEVIKIIQFSGKVVNVLSGRVNSRDLDLNR